MDNVFIFKIIKDILIYMCVVYVFIKSINYKIISYKTIIPICIIAFVLGIISAFISIKYNYFIAYLVCLPIFSVSIAIITKMRITYIQFLMLLSLGLSLGTNFIAALIVSILARTITEYGNNYIVIAVVATSIIQLLLLYYFFKIKRFKNGFNFVKNEKFANNIGVLGIIFNIIIISIYFIVSSNHIYYKIGIFFWIVVLLCCIAIFLWIKHQITAHYKRGLKEDAIHDLEVALAEEKAKNESANAEINRLTDINHKYTTRIKVAEMSVKKLAENMNTEISDEITGTIKMIEDLSDEFKEANSKNVEIDPKISVTNILAIDNLILYFRNTTNHENIEFEFKSDVNIQDFVPDKIPQNKLETLISDHMNDAIIAINHGNCKGNILLEFINNNGAFEIHISDNGIEFEIDTLLKLGKEKITTHKNTGGTGTGFMTTFNTLKETKASMEIEEYEKNSKTYTKTVKVIFDNKNEYRIKSYRKEEIKNLDKESRIKLI